MRTLFRSAAVAAVTFCLSCTGSKGGSGLADAGLTTSEKAPAAKSIATSLDPALVVATVAGAPVTAKELDDSIKEQVSHEASTFQEHLDKIRGDGLDALIAQKLVEKEAKARGME